ncbi:MAG: ArnT family glycosyltransferase [Gemmataceae bacterium]
MTTTLQEPTWSPQAELSQSTATPEQLELSDTSKHATTFGALAVVVVNLLFFLTWWNQYLPPTTLPNIFFHHAATHGEYPYRDYFHPGQPGRPAFAVLFFSLVGPRVIYGYVLAIALRLGALVCLYSLLTRFCKPTFAALAVITMHIVSSGDQADTPIAYHHFLPVFAVYAVYFAMRILDNPRGWGNLWAVVAGISLGMCFLVKQPAALSVAVLGGFLSVAIWKRYGFKQSMWSSLYGILGFSLPVGGVFLWLVSFGAFGEYIEQAFLTGPSAKGGLRLALVRPISGLWTLGGGQFPATVALLIGSFLWGTSFWSRVSQQRKQQIEGKDDESKREGRRFGPLSLTVTLSVLVLGLYFLYLGGLSARMPGLAVTLLGEFGCLAVFLWAFRTMLGGQTDSKTQCLALVSLCGFISAFTLGMSWVVYEPMAVPGLAVVLAVALGLTPPSETVFRRVVVGMCFVLVVLGCVRKWERPYGWGGWRERSVRVTHTTSRLPELAGFRLDTESVKFFDGVTEHIQKHTSPDEPIYIYPHLSAFYVLSDRPRAVFARQHYWDVCPNGIAKQDAKLLREHPPKVIVRMEFPERAHRLQEELYRGGEKSGQRELTETMDQILKSYDLVATYRDNLPGCPVRVYVRRK